MGRLRGLSALTFATILLGMATLNGVLLALTIPLLLFILTGLFYEPRSPDLIIERVLNKDRAAIGAPVVVTIRVTNQDQGIEELHLNRLAPQSLDMLDGQRGVLLSMDPHQTIDFEFVVSGKRGVHVFPKIVATASDHFSLWHKQSNFEAPAALAVLPRALPLKRLVIRPRRTRGYSGQIPTRLGGPGVDFFGLRSYEPGDPMQRIDWKASARHIDMLFTKMYEQERVADVSLILDARQSSEISGDEDSLLEYSIHAAAALAETFLAAGNRVGLLVYGDLLDWTFPRYGKIQGERILQKLAQTSPAESPAFIKLDNLPTRLFPPSSQIVFIGPLLRTDIDMLSSMPTRGFPLLVISPDPVRFAYQSIRPGEHSEMAMRIARLERALSLRMLRQAGVQVVDWHVDIPFKQVASANLSRPPAWLRSIGVDS